MVYKVAWGAEIKEIVDPLSYQKIVGYERLEIKQMQEKKMMQAFCLPKSV